MQQLEALTRDAKALANGHIVVDRPADISEGVALSAADAEVARQLQICNACRYCEGFCAMFPAMTRRLSFGKADIHYLANLCHSCGACLHACQYAPPHEFAVNVPQSMAKVRVQTYADYAWPPALGSMYQRHGLKLSLAAAGALSLFLLLALVLNGSLFGVRPGANFYAVFPHNLLVTLFLPVFAFSALALTLGVRRFWREVSPGDVIHPAAASEAAGNALALTYLDGGHGAGCNNEDDAWTLWRRRFHHAAFYGFMLCFAATSVATVYHYAFGWVAPYALPSLPKLLGVVGGISLCVGAAGLLWLNLHRHALHGDPDQKPMDRGFIALLFLISASGLGLWLATGKAAMPALLALHLGVVMALFVTLPYGKFAHGVFRSAALLKWAIEKRMPSQLKLRD